VFLSTAAVTEVSLHRKPLCKLQADSGFLCGEISVTAAWSGHDKNTPFMKLLSFCGLVSRQP
jgi:hypothetical protein